MANALSYADLSDIGQVKASGEIAALSVQNNGARAIRRGAEEGLNTGDHVAIQRIALGRTGQPQQCHRTLLAHAQTVGQSMSRIGGVLRIVHLPLPPLLESVRLGGLGLQRAFRLSTVVTSHSCMSKERGTWLALRVGLNVGLFLLVSISFVGLTKDRDQPAG